MEGGKNFQNLTGTLEFEDACSYPGLEAGDYIRFIPIDEEEFLRIQKLVEKGKYQCVIHEGEV